MIASLAISKIWTQKKKKKKPLVPTVDASQNWKKREKTMKFCVHVIIDFFFHFFNVYFFAKFNPRKRSKISRIYTRK
jgi:hypothetical protein